MYDRNFKDVNLLQIHYEDMRECGPILTKEEELSLFEKFKNGDKDSKQEIWIRNMGLATHFAKNYRNNGLPFLDLINEGYIGLEKAIELFDHKKGNKFSTYASIAIKRKMEAAIMNKSGLIRKPENKHGEFRKYLRTKANLSEKLNREPSSIEIADAMYKTQEEIESLKLYFKNPDSLDRKVYEGDSSNLRLEDMIKDDSFYIEEITENKLMHQMMYKLIDQLKPEHKQVLYLRFGLEDGIERTLQEVGTIIGLSRERVRQLEQRALQILKNEPKFLNLVFE